MLPDPGTDAVRDLPTIDDLLDRTHVVALPMRVRFRGVTVREVALLDGPAGWGEFGPFPEYDDPEAAWWLRSALEMGWQGPPPALRSRVPVNATVPDVPPERVAEVLGGFPGCRTVKVKVAGDDSSLARDLARVGAVLDERPGARVRVDANGGWTVGEAAAAAAELARLCRDRGATLDYLEQPCRTVPELVELRTRLAADGVRAPVAADESIRRAGDPEAVVAAGGADRAVLKAAPLGGPRRLLRVAEALGVPVTVSSALDSAVGLAAGLASAAALPGPDPDRPGEIPACGLGTADFFVEDVVTERSAALVDAGTLRAGVVSPEPDRLAALAVTGARRDWWLDRLRRCHGLLAAG